MQHPKRFGISLRLGRELYERLRAIATIATMTKVAIRAIEIGLPQLEDELRRNLERSE